MARPQPLSITASVIPAEARVFLPSARTLFWETQQLFRLFQRQSPLRLSASLYPTPPEPWQLQEAEQDKTLRAGQALA